MLRRRLGQIEKTTQARDDDSGEGAKDVIAALLPPDFLSQGDVYVFVGECH